MKTESTFFIRITSIFLLAVSTFLASPNRLEAQCQMACTGKVNASMHPLTCETIVKPNSLMNATAACPLTNYKVLVKYLNVTIPANGVPSDSVVIPVSWIGRTVEVSVFNAEGNKCWGNLKVEDKSAPVIDCPDTIYNLYCFQNPNKMRPDSLGIGVTDCSNFGWSAVGLPSITECVDVTVSGLPTKAIKRIVQNWRATDIHGMSADCRVSYNLLSIPEDSIKGPANKDVACFPSFAKTAEGYPHPSVTGYPYFVYAPGDTFYLKTNDATLAGACNITVNFTDRALKEGKKILRKWTVSGWLCGEIFDNTYDQVILIVDENLPSLTVTPPSRTVTTSGHACSALVRLNNLYTVTASDVCSPVKVTAFLNDSEVSTTSLITVPLGNNSVRYVATDESGNTRSATVALIVEDKTPPTAICMRSTVAITNAGTARIPAAYFNNGSKDECGPVTFSVRRMDRKINCDTTTSQAFHPHVDFCCTDVGSNVMIELRVTDESGNSNTCMVEIEVQNKIRPTLTCPEDGRFACNTAFTLDSAGLAQRFGVATVSSGCGTPIVRHSFENKRDQCGVGEIIRKWVVFNGTTKIDSCTQRLFFFLSGGSRFTVNVEDPSDTTDHIVWPKAEVEIVGCLSPGSPRLSTDSIGKPVILYDRFGCGIIAMSHTDHVFSINTPVAGSNNACLKILRTWKVIDWCQDDVKRDPYTFQQVIKVINTVPPTLGTIVTKDSCAQLASCTDSITHTLTAAATDDCSGTLAWTYSIDLGNNGNFDIVVSGSGGTINATRKLPLGRHRIVYTFRDLCGNAVSADRLFRLSNCKAPTPYLHQRLAIGIMKMNGGGMITTWAKDFEKGSSHPCGGPLYWAFSPTRFDTARTFTCADLGDTTLRVYVGYAYAPGDTVWNSAEVVLSIQDNNNPSACGNTALATKTVRGQLATELNEHLKDAQVFLDGNQISKLMSDEYGYFEFSNALKGHDYVLRPYKNDDIDNGVNTLDLIRIQRHILGISKLDSPYKMIAADVNRDGRVNLGDLVELRKVVLGIYNTLPSNTSWRFIEKAYQFRNTENALTESYNEQYDIQRLNDNMTIDFVSVKVGDIDANATTKSTTTNSNLTSRTANVMTLRYDDKVIDKGEYVKVPVYLENVQNLTGIQLGLGYDNDMLDFADIDIKLPNALSNSGFSVNDGELRMSWNNATENSIKDVAIITFRAKSRVRLSEVLESAKFVSQAYDKELNSFDLEIRTNNTENVSFEMKQNIPNPFSDVTEIVFTLPQTQSATLRVFDIKGSQVFKTTDKFEAGKNSIFINRKDIGKTGMYYYTLEAGQFTATKKLVILD